MIKKIFITLLLTSGSVFSIKDSVSLAINQEAQQDNFIVTKDSHPNTYNLIEDLSERCKMPMPKKIFIKDGWFSIITDYHTIEKGLHDLIPYYDINDNLNIYLQTLQNFSKEEIEGLLALAIANKKQNVGLKVFATGAITAGVTAAIVAYSLYTNNKFGKFLKSAPYKGQVYYNYGPYPYRVTTYSYTNSEEKLQTLIELIIAPTMLLPMLHYNYLQKSIDKKALYITSKENIIAGIKAVKNYIKGHSNPGFFAKLAKEIKLTKAFKFFTYPVRPFTTKERIQYLKNC